MFGLNNNNNSIAWESDEHSQSSRLIAARPQEIKDEYSYNQNVGSCGQRDDFFRSSMLGFCSPEGERQARSSIHNINKGGNTYWCYLQFSFSKKSLFWCLICPHGHILAWKKITRHSSWTKAILFRHGIDTERYVLLMTCNSRATTSMYVSYLRISARGNFDHNGTMLNSAFVSQRTSFSIITVIIRL